jgi:SNF2 family DNA or RNA helicase
MMPEVFSSDEDFKEWFDFGGSEKGAAKMASKGESDEDMIDAEEQMEIDASNSKNFELIESLHKIMRPFLLRRTKADLENKLPDKIEIIVNTNMSPMQFDIYEQLLKSQSIFSEQGGRRANSK